MYNLILKSGSYDIKPASKNGMIDMNNYLFHYLIKLGLTPNRDCCGNSNLKIKKGILVKTKTNDLLYLNLDKWISKKLIQYGVITQSQFNAICCDVTNNTNIIKEFVYFKTNNQKKAEGFDLNKWLKKTLDLYNITAIDPCC